MASQAMDLIAKALEHSAKLVEEKVDAQLSKLNEMEEDDLERLKERRLEALKKAQKQKQVCGTVYTTTLQTYEEETNIPKCSHCARLYSVFLLKEWLSKGHGEYREISSEKDFFGEVKDSKNVVCHFYKNSTFR